MQCSSNELNHMELALTLRRIVPFFAVCVSCAATAPAAPQDLSETVIAISDFKVSVHPKHPIRPKTPWNPEYFIAVEEQFDFGTAFCVDPACRFVGTNYHVVKEMRVRRIEGEKVIQQYEATGPYDDAAVVPAGPHTQAIKYAPIRDLAIFELGRPLDHHHGIAYSVEDLDEGQEVDIYAYPMHSKFKFRKLEEFHGRYKGLSTRGLLVFDYDLSDGRKIVGGASGGIVVDRRTRQMVGILRQATDDVKPLALAVPIKSLVEFVSKVQPYLAERIFPHHMKAISPVAPDLYPQFVELVSHVLRTQRPEETPDVRALRKKAQDLADRIQDFIAVQTFAWGSEDKEEPVAAAAYEIRVLDGYQRFSDGVRQFKDVPLPSRPKVSFATGGEWAELPQWIGTKLNLKIHQAADSVVNDRPIKVFQYNAAAEDGLCKWDTQVDYGIFTSHHPIDVAVHGEVWADDDLNILRVSEHCELPENLKWKNYEAVVTYGWLNRVDEEPQLVPLTIYASVKFKDKSYWCRGLFTDYQGFRVHARIVTN